MNPAIHLPAAIGLFLNQRGNPQNGYGTHNGRAQLTQDSTPLDAELTKQPTTDKAAKQAQHQIHDESETATLHQLAGTEASQTTDNN
jgi:hypothetical protein